MGADSVRQKKIWIISPFSDPTNSDSADRYRYLCQELTDKGAKICQFVSAFNHDLKRRRKLNTTPSWRCVKVFEPGYSKNVSIRRILSHVVFDCMIVFYFVFEFLRSGRPDTILVALPHNGAACVATIFARIIRARLIVDVHDTWPESFLSIAKLNSIRKVGYYLWKACADFPLLCADMVFGQSERYAERANTIRHRFGRLPAQKIYLGGDPSYYQEIQPESIPDELNGASFIVAYAGNLGENYDFDCIIDAFVAFAKECPNAGLMFLGGGEHESHIKSRLLSYGVRSWVSGRIPHRLLIAYLKHSKVGLNCFKPMSNVAYSYKLNDYLLTGVPVINSLSGESAEFISKNDLGVNYKAGDINNLLDAIRFCHAKWIKNPCWSDRVKEFSLRTLDRHEIYRPLIQCCMHGRITGEKFYSMRGESNSSSDETS